MDSYVNPKCVYFSIFLILGYLFLPEGDKQIAISVFATFFLLIMLYHEVYLCKYPQGYLNINLLLLNISLSFLAALGYFYLTKWKYNKSSVIVTAFFIFVFGYVGMAVYDDLYDCEDTLRHNYISFTHLFKPRAARITPENPEINS